MVALACVEDEFPLTEPLCDQMRIAFLWDDQDAADGKRRLARRAYNALADRLSNLGLKG